MSYKLNFSYVVSLLFTSIAHLSKVASGFILLKLMAIYLGVEGLGYMGHFMSAVTAILLLAGGGVVNGVIKHVAEYKDVDIRLAAFLSSALAYSLLVSAVLFFVIVLFVEDISHKLFGEQRVSLVYALAFGQILIALVNIYTGFVNGLQQSQRYATVQIAGFIISLPVIWYLVAHHGVFGTGIAILAVYVAPLVPATLFLLNTPMIKSVSCVDINVRDLKKLLPFSVMALVSVISVPVVEIAVRQMIISADGYVSAGIWQASMKLSSAYLGFFAVFLAYVFVPKISGPIGRGQLTNELRRVMLFIGALFFVGACVLLYFRDFFIKIIFSDEFILLRDVLPYQLFGDFFKVLAYAIGYIAIAKASAKVYVLAEIVQYSVFLCSSLLAVSYANNALLAVMNAYVISYALYLCMAVSFFVIYYRRQA